MVLYAFPFPLNLVSSSLGQVTLGGRYHWVYFALQSVTPCCDQPRGSCLCDILPPSRGGICLITMAWTMVTVGSAGFLSMKGEGAGGTDPQRVQGGLISQDFGSCQAVACQRCPCRGQFHAKAVASGTRKIDRIFPRYLRFKTYCTILTLTKIITLK